MDCNQKAGNELFVRIFTKKREKTYLFPPMRAKPQPEAPSKAPDGQKASDDYVLKTATAVAQFISAIVGKLGVPGAIFFAVFYIFVKYGTQTQKEEFIDLFILWKFVGNPEWTWTVIGILLIFLVSQRYYYGRRLRLKDEEIDRLSGRKTESQSKRMGKTLNSSGKAKPKRSR